MTPPSRRATIRTRHARPVVVAAALRPDNTDAMTTRVERDAGADGDAGSGDSAPAARTGPGTVVTRIERDATGSLRTTVDDYVSNLQVAQRVVTDSDYTTTPTPDDTP